MRLSLPNGQWADLRERLDYGPAREVRRIMAAMTRDPAAMADLDLALIRAYLDDWYVLALDGSQVPPGNPEAAPDDILQTLANECLKRWGTKPKGLPKAGGERSRNSLQALG